MKTCIVRAVDSGNIQRSPTFQAIFNYTFSTSTDLPFSIIFDSGGIDVDKILTNNTPAAKKLSIIDAGLYYDLIHGKNQPLASELIYNWYDRSNEEIPEKENRIITQVYSEIKTDVHTIQMKYRNDALMEVGILKEFLPGMREPFRHEKDLQLVLPVEKTVVKKVLAYYQDLESEVQKNGVDIDKPIIKIYGDIVGIEPLKDELKGGMKTARKQVKYFMDTRYKAFKEIINLLMK
jgi:hypothetical protein